ncbi:hypothetical protein ES708_07935 [subsurface metagenome]
MSTRQILGRINDFYTKIEEGIIIGAAFFLILLTLVAVFNRYFIKYSLAWYEEVAIISYMLLVYWGASNAAKNDEHLRVTILLDKFKGKVGIYLNLFSELSCLIISIIGIYFAIKITLITSAKTVFLGIPNSIILFFSLTMGFFGLTLRYLYKFVASLNKLNVKDKNEVSNNDY